MQTDSQTDRQTGRIVINGGHYITCLAEVAVKTFVTHVPGGAACN